MNVGFRDHDVLGEYAVDTMEESPPIFAMA